MKRILNENKEVLFEGDAEEMELAFSYLTKPLHYLAESIGLKMADAYELNKRYWNGESRAAKEFFLVEA